MPMVSFVVPMFNHLAKTKLMYDSLLASVPENLSFELIFVDDASSDGSREWLASLRHPTVKVILNDANLGFARSNHAGIAHSSGEFLALLNNDLILQPGWLEPMLAILENPTLDAGLVGNVQFRVDDDSIDHAGIAVLPNAKLSHIQLLPNDGRRFAEAFAVTGACCVVPRKLFNEIGGFDENFVNGGEDVDLCIRLRLAGKKIYIAYDSRIKHHVSATRGGNGLQCEKNSRLLQKKWRPFFKQAILRSQFTQPLLACPSAPKAARAHEPQIRTVLPACAYALLAVEAALRREEARWHNIFDTPNDVVTSNAQRVRLRTLGFMPTATGHGVSMGPLACLLLECTESVESIQLVGLRLPEWRDRSLRVEVIVNRCQAYTFMLENERRFILRMLNPIFIEGCMQSFSIEANIPDAILLSHVLVNGEMHIIHPGEDNSDEATPLRKPQ
ncbi:glycosyltransferase family 2 protein [Azohydromonas lata]|uniref:Glycosyltransferase family 2 protein n=1 Tax=Azohydromonas lata TaxID=45677 RepID=A0ABU5IN59_9BURK|nr:glycosyltransferase family 2 protein [Azohydromonas lata]MDZ5460322.1 glycosyltransferase family 2 protein [Azohydromonas lata]